MITEINDTNFDSSISSGVCLIDFWAPWCGPCRMLSPVIDELSEEMKEVKFFKFNVDEGKQTPTKFNIMGIPALLLFKDGKMVAQRSGMAPKKIIQDWITNSIK
ncbi:MAG TPA: thioredoxin [Rickettsiales bacterium]|nr:thioredoxin [Rickettsiales bacterium]